MQKTCACWGTKSLSLGLGGGSWEGKFQSWGFPTSGGENESQPALEGLGWDHCLGAYGGGVA